VGGVYTDGTLLHRSRSQVILQDDVTIAIAPKAEDMRADVMGAEFSGWSMALRQFFRPCVLTVLALAVTVGAWGFGYKLSQYLQHSDVSRASATRLWVEHRDDAFEAPDHHQHQPQKLLSPAFLGFNVLIVEHFSRERIFAEPAPSRILTFVSSLHPLRAPPTSHSLLA